MAVYRPRALDFRRGLETTRDTRSEDPFGFVEFLNGRVDKATARRRNGMVRLYRWAAGSDLMEFDGTNDYVTVRKDSRVWPWPTRFTFEMLFKTDTVAADRQLLGSSTASNVGLKIVHNTSGNVVTTITDSASTATTVTHTGVAAGAVHAYQLVRDGASVTVRIDGTAQTATMHATNLLIGTGIQSFGQDNGASYYKGWIDFARLRRVARSDQADGWARLPDPRAPSVIFDYVFENDANDYILDRGPYGLHAAASGSPVSTSAALAVNPAPILGITQNRDSSAARQGYVRVGGAFVPVRFG